MQADSATPSRESKGLQPKRGEHSGEKENGRGVHGEVAMKAIAK